MLSPIDMFLRPLEENAWAPILAIRSGNMISIKESQSENMKAGISIMFDGNDIEDSFLHL